MKTGISPRVDIVFKKIFGSPAHSDLTLHLLNALLPLAGRPPARTVTILNPFSLADFEGEKSIVLDLKLTDESGRDFQIEIQVQSFPSLDRRMLDNWARLYSAQILEGEDYDSHLPAIAIWIMEGEHFDDGQWLHVFEVRDRDTGLGLHEDFLILTMELATWRRLSKEAEGGIVGGGERKWLALLSRGEDLDPEDLPPALADADIQEALTIMRTFTTEDAERHLYWRRQEFIWSRNSELSDAREQGIALGLAEGESKRAIEDARRFKALGVAIDIIAEGTGLTREEVERL